jgi:hypothetical protein
MPLKKIPLKPGVNRENTRYTNEGGWYESDKVRFRQGTPEKLGGWTRISTAVFLGVCRSLWNWITLAGIDIIGVGTNNKFYLSVGGGYNDITPARAQVTLTNPFQTFVGSPTVTVTDASAGFGTGDFVSFYGGTAVGGLTLYGEYEITATGSFTYTITADANATSNATGGGTVYALYQIPAGPVFEVPLTGWGAAAWGAGAWGVGETSTVSLRLWSQQNYGQSLIFGPRGGSIYFWDVALGISSSTNNFTATVASPTLITTNTQYVNGTPLRFETEAGGTMYAGITPGALYYVRNVSGLTFNISATPTGALIGVTGAAVGIVRVLPNAYELSTFGGATDVPTHQNYLLVSDVSRFVFAFGANEYGSTTVDPMLIRWSDQEDPYNWTPAPTNQAGFLRLSRGSEIITAVQSRQEVLVWTDAALYSLQYVGAPIVWGAQIVGENISIVGQNAVAFSNGVSYWMGKDKFYKYDGRSQTLNCDLRRYVFSDINTTQYAQICAGTNEGFNEVWWFYCSANSTEIDKYVIYNYVENVWYYGSLGRTAWLDSGLRSYPIAATYAHNIVNHEEGVDDNMGATTLPIEASITSAQFDLDDGHNFMFVWRVLPDMTFEGSTADAPSATMYLLPLKNSGSGYSVNKPTDSNHSVADSSFANVTRVATLPVEEFTGQIFTRVRGRQMSIKVESTELGVNWQLGSPRVDMRQDGRR